MARCLSILLLHLFVGSHATPVVDQAALAQITPSPVQDFPTKTSHRKRGVISDLTGDVDSLLSQLGSDVPSYVASGIPDFFQSLPTGDSVVSSIGLNKQDIAALPTQVLNMDTYANWTSQGWNVRFHGNVYKQPNLSNETLNRLADDLFIYGTKISALPESQQAQARNLTAEIFVVQQGSVNVSTMHVESLPAQGAGGQSEGAGTAGTSGRSQDVTLPQETTPEGDFDLFLPIQAGGMEAGNTTQKIQRLAMHVQGASLGNATAYLAPTAGITIVSDIDDILRVTKIYDPKEGLLNSFARPYTPWENMPQIYANWSTLSNVHFHYLTTTPEQVTRNYMQFIYDFYPGGSFDTRPLNFSDVSATLSIRKYLLIKIFETFPQRKFVLVADTSNSDIMKDYPQMAHDFPNQVACIFLRNTSATDPQDKFPYDTSGFKGLDQRQYMFFVHANDLTNLDIENGQCYNRSIPQNLTFGEQGLPFGLGSKPQVNGSASGAHESSGGLSAVPTTVLPALFLLGCVSWLVL